MVNVTGPQDFMEPPEMRKGPLWELYRQLKGDGWFCDADSYVTDFRVDVKKTPGKSLEDLKAVQNSLPPNIASAFNLGKADFFPVNSGKENAVQYIASTLGVDMSHTYALFDDNNDIEMGRIVSKCFLPSPLSEEMVHLSKLPEFSKKWHVSKRQGILGIEEHLEHILQDIKARYGDMKLDQYKPTSEFLSEISDELAKAVLQDAK
mmetsp:Transcript_40430/g.65593  ORF Transcript_40430/g.65593 Transcript_40430/m.65593 type:complete len:206 (-) Transcript_40430:1015-1632(-)|eukprot:CAMPEP_0184334686 /NCGR_PEP_ID=MMETSP1089-20130417/3381_1 /TAXON_ID=38269 ORGANISM="Gloeochaete wittrockiana, Strain SAG46.84" /NCGR_SAMPLE_ID=MMETSP1089 /ASSEMBLY_ACC=CAM_ASM_000445 /LENGTH=205 /DNA_ID=CAMNT_0026659007 /DNA_START=800 /DNA_END=1417 /DNA_ORIENTATION=+